jgi:cell wall-associated NlpC family hydrolase
VTAVFALRSRRRPARQSSSWAGPVLAIVVVAVLVSSTTKPAKPAAGHRHAAGGVAAQLDATAPTAAAATAISWAKQQVGCPYVYGGTGPCDAGFDCSGLLMVAWQQAGVSIPRTTEAMWADLPHVSMRHLRPGDLLLYTGSPIDPPPGHVVMYIGHGQIIQAYGTGVPVAVTDGIPPGAWGAVRPG